MAVAKKVLIGMATFAVLCAIAGAGYAFGKHLAQQDDRASAHAPPAAQAAG